MPKPPSLIWLLVAASVWIGVFLSTTKIIRSIKDGKAIRCATPKAIPTAKEAEEADRQADRSGGGMVEGKQTEVP
jgi:hypothetical protein